MRTESESQNRIKMKTESESKMFEMLVLFDLQR